MTGDSQRQRAMSGREGSMKDIARRYPSPFASREKDKQ
jgi:hypothetical protein